MTVVQVLPHDLAVIDAVETTGKPVGFAQAPAGALAAVQAGTGPDYYVVHPISGTRDGSLSDPFADADLVYQITCVGRLAAGVRYLVGQLETALAGVSISGRSVLQIVPEDDGAVRPDFDVDPPVFIATPRYRLSTTPT